MAKIHIEGRAYEVDESRNLLDVCLSLGLDLPYFCWHPAMGSVGACRQCAVKQYRNEDDSEGQLVMACMTAAADGTRISLDDAEAQEFRESVIEWLMVNHPHDCPVCDEGGECHLQDMTLMTGHTYRRYRFKKRSYRNQYLGPFINHEMNRCIQCYRCVRFYKDYADGRDFDVLGVHDRVYFGRHEDGVLENEFSGNLVEVCPTGVFTDKTLKKHYTRKWDLQTAPSLCVLCSVGCNTIPGERYGELRRVQNRFNREVNGYFICDRGRYGYQFVNSDLRIRFPELRAQPAGNVGASDRGTQSTSDVDSKGQTRGWDGIEADPLSQADSAGSESVRAFLNEALKGGVVGVGSPRASLEANFALRMLVGPERFCSGMGEHEQALVGAALEMLQRGPARTPSLHEIEEADAILVLGEDLTNTAPMMAYAVRQAARNRPHAEASELGIPLWNDYAIREIVQGRKGSVFVATVGATKLEDIATGFYHATPGDIARLGMAIAQAIDGAAPAPRDLDDDLRALAGDMAAALREAERPVVISGTGCGTVSVMQAAANVAWALNSAGVGAGLSLALPEANSMGAALLGGKTLQAARQMLESGEAETLIVLENDLYRRAEPTEVDALLAAAGRIVVVDSLRTATTERADLALPAATFAEGDGTLVNQEGRAQRFLQVFVPESSGMVQGQPVLGVKESWRWIQDMLAEAGREETWRELDDVLATIANMEPVLAPIVDITPPSEFRLVEQKVPRQPHRYSGRTAIRAHINVHEPKPPDDVDAPMSFTMEGFRGQPPASLLPRYWAPGWNSVQALNKFQSEVGGPLKGGDPGRRLVERADAQAPYFAEAPAAFEAPVGRLLVVPLHHIYGSEPLSMLTPGVAERAPDPYVALNRFDAERLQIEPGSTLNLRLGPLALALPAQIMPSLPPGVAGLPVGLPGMPYSQLPGWAQVGGSERGEP